MVLVSEENKEEIQNFLLKKLKHFIKENPESLLEMDLFKSSLANLLWETQKFLELLQIYNFQIIIDCPMTFGKSYYFVKFCAQVLQEDFYHIDSLKNDFCLEFRKIIISIIKAQNQKEIKSIILIKIDSAENHLLLNCLSTVIDGINISVLLDKEEMAEIMEFLKNDSDLESLKYDHKIFKISKKLMTSIKFILYMENHNDHNLKRERPPSSDFILKNFIKFPFKDASMTSKEIEEFEKEIIKSSFSEIQINKIEYAKSIELSLSPHFEDVYDFNLLNSRDHYIRFSEAITYHMKKLIEQKYQYLKTGTQFGKINDYLIKTKQNFKESIMTVERNIENLEIEAQKQIQELEENKESVKNLSLELEGKI